MHRDVSRVRHCILGRTRFPFGRIEYGTKGPIKLDTEKKLNVMQITNVRQNMQTAYSTKKLNIPISHNGEMIEFYFNGNFVNDYMYVQLEELSFGYPSVALHDRSCFFRRDNRRRFQSAANYN